MSLNRIAQDYFTHRATYLLYNMYDHVLRLLAGHRSFFFRAKSLLLIAYRASFLLKLPLSKALKVKGHYNAKSRGCKSDSRGENIVLARLSMKYGNIC